MKLNAGIVTNKLAETKLFYTSVLSFAHPACRILDSIFVLQIHNRK